MFGRIQPVKNGSAVYAAEPADDGGPEPGVGDFHLRRSCLEFLETLRACADMISVSGSDLTADRQNLEIAREKMNRALQELRSFRASCAVGFQLKLESWLALEELFGEEDSRVIGFAHELVREAHPFFSAGNTGGDEPLLKASGGFSDRRRLTRLSLPRLPWFSGEPRPTVPGRARRSQT
jgi:hypothetical protein